jgi:DNA excision repair protein ERCC-4
VSFLLGVNQANQRVTRLTAELGGLDLRTQPLHHRIDQGGTDELLMDRLAITIDDRERGSALFDLLQSAAHIRVAVERLSVGDYDVDGRFLFERKTLPDLIDSIKSGRLFQQALRLLEVKYRQPALVLEGTINDLRGSNMRWEAIQGALVTVSLFLGLPILRARGPAETLRTFEFAARQAHAIASGALQRRGRRPKGKAALQRHILQGLPGIGPARAAGLLEHFGTVQAVLSADRDEIASVPGIGPRTAGLVTWAVRDQAAEYGLQLPTAAVDADFTDVIC